MNAVLQTFGALAVVAIAAAWLVFRVFAKRKNPSCGGDCGCAAQKFSSTLKRP
jgi:hypothetical protein